MFSFAITGKNITQPDVHLMQSDIVPAEYRAGCGVRLKTLNLVVDGVYFNNLNRDWRVLTGTEFSVLNKMVGLRAGFGYGSKEYRNLAIGAGCGLKIHSFVAQLDYAFTLSLSKLVAGANGNHYVSLTIKF